jgi:hypothetical protein
MVDEMFPVPPEAVGVVVGQLEPRALIEFSIHRIRMIRDQPGFPGCELHRQLSCSLDRCCSRQSPAAGFSHLPGQAWGADLGKGRRLH